MNSEQIFAGNIIGEKTTLENFYKTFQNLETIYLGRSKNSQYGKAKIEFDVSFLESDFTSEIESEKQSNLTKEFSLTFLSNTIIYNEEGFAIVDIANFEKYLGVKIKKSFVKVGSIENYVSVWKSRKPS